MSWSLIASPLWRESRSLLQNLPLPAQDLGFAPQPLQFGRHVLLADLGRIIDLVLTATVDQ
ncbi:hypothetical protein JQC81_28135 [Microvirga arabica]|nr:hypothetical protein [Microvirga arabica]